MKVSDMKKGQTVKVDDALYTIVDYHQDNSKQSTGFLFEDSTAPALADCLRRALNVYQDRRRWRGLQRRGMKKDFSWNSSAEKYYILYKELIFDN